ncbi:MAG: Lrp/AsnC family transcriptional regulator [SAR324 cluster bacterium]|nr:Lrp/AsnC family transcriptional regulator [SAR324 cluster bacterium]MBL7035808.1 Lrp/AsnC family transcriptional regulator [SAR324 cluster bacterium]
MKLDEIDLNILVALQDNGRITKTKLAEKVHLSVSPCHERVKRLEQAGYIKGYQTKIDIDRIVRNSLVFVQVHLKQHRAEDFIKFNEAILQTPEVIECHALGGGVDYYLKMIVNDIKHYQQKIEFLLGSDLNIERYYTHIVTKLVKQSGYPIAELLMTERDL